MKKRKKRTSERQIKLRILIIPKDDLESDLSFFNNIKAIRAIAKQLRKIVKEDEAIVGYDVC